VADAAAAAAAAGRTAVVANSRRRSTAGEQACQTRSRGKSFQIFIIDRLSKRIGNFQTSPIDEISAEIHI
jgi:hypothetical protein